jgi:hypothetical protein
VTLKLGTSYTLPSLTDKTKSTFVLAIMDQLQIATTERVIIDRVTAITTSPPIVQITFHISGKVFERKAQGARLV